MGDDVTGPKVGWFTSAGPTRGTRPSDDAVSAPAVVPRFIAPGLAAATTGPLAIISVAGAVTPDGLDQIFRALAAHRSSQGDYATMYLFRARVPLPDDATRRKVRELLGTGRTAAHACAVLDSDGFWTAAARGVLAGFALVHPRAPAAVRSIDEGLSWIQSRLGARGAGLSGLGPAIAAFRARHHDGTLPPVPATPPDTADRALTTTTTASVTTTTSATARPRT